MRHTMLSLIAQLDPRIYDVFPPQHLRPVHRGDLVALNPQPLPPRAPFADAALDLAAEVLRTAVAAGGSETRALGDVIDDWCKTPWPRRWPFPVPVGNEPSPTEIASGRIAAALAFASAGSRIQDEHLAAALLDGADRLAEAALADLAAAGSRPVPAQATA